MENHATFIIYGKEGCSHCVRAKEHAKAKGLDYEYLTLDRNYTKEELLRKCSPVIPNSLPRVFVEVDGVTTYVGTCDEFVASTKNL